MNTNLACLVLSAVGCYLMICQRFQSVLSTSFHHSVYSRDLSCNFHGKYNYSCAKLVAPRALSSTECGGLCSKKESCEGYSRDVKDKCYLHFHCPRRTDLYRNCSSPDTDIRYYLRKPGWARSCLNGGRWREETKDCRCKGGYVGTRCERYRESCDDLSRFRARTYRSRYSIKPVFANVSFFVYCYISPREQFYSQTVILRHENGMKKPSSFTFNYTWEDYVHGFYQEPSRSTSDGWIGLKTIHYLNTVEERRTLILSVYRFDDKARMALEYTFYGIEIGDATTNYQLSYDYVTMVTQYPHLAAINESAMAPCVSPGAPVPFSTPDVDNDLDDNVHCAKEAGAGWWFSVCSPRPSCNPLGTPYPNGTEDVTPAKLYFQGLDIKSLPFEIDHIRLSLD